mmetsp:Transcript_51629/g.82002  ORF Transcript_51629/g.82002 Transcript_51629/m.82002 type:complete len:362 (-) Transcript_51629:99-1184(-)
MWIHNLQRCAVKMFLVLFTWFPLVFSVASEVCDGTAASVKATMLLHFDKTVKSVRWHKSEANVSKERYRQPPAVSLSEMPSSHVTSRRTTLANLAYDSDDECGEGAVPEIDMVGLEEYSTHFLEILEINQGYAHKDDAAFSSSVLKVWNDLPEIRASHNCYMYALNDLSPRSSHGCLKVFELFREGRLHVDRKALPKACKQFFHKPGYYFQNVISGRESTDSWSREDTTCNLMLPMIAADSPSIQWTNRQNASLTEADMCPKAFYMVALFIHPKAGFHFYRRDHVCEDGSGRLCWSHKPGILEATKKDASGAMIRSVLKADRNYGELNYSEHCAFFCVPENSRASTNSDSRKLRSRGGSQD